MALDTITLQKPLRKLRKTVRKLPRRPSPELVHDLRTRIRRIEAQFQALLLDSRQNERKLLKALKPIRSRAGKVRDMDVLTSYALTLRPDADEECLLELIEYLGAKRYRQAQKLHKVVGRDAPATASRLKRSAKYIAKVCDNSSQRAGNANVWPTDAMAVALSLAKELSRWPRLNAGNLHPFRLKVKQLRYILQLSDNSDSALVETLGEVKDAAGEWHDWEELAAIAAKVLDHDSGRDLLNVIRSTAAKKLHHALLIANRMRKDYLKRPSRIQRKGLRRPLTVLLKTPVVEAASSLAA